MKGQVDGGVGCPAWSSGMYTGPQCAAHILSGARGSCDRGGACSSSRHGMTDAAGRVLEGTSSAGRRVDLSPLVDANRATRRSGSR